MSFGYQSSQPCEVCGGHKNNQCEPRFGYTVCEDHQHITPNRIHKDEVLPLKQWYECSNFECNHKSDYYAFEVQIRDIEILIGGVWCPKCGCKLIYNIGRK